MTNTYTITAVGDKREWSNDYGVYWAYPLTLEDSAGQKHLGVEWSRKQTSRAPEPGERLVAEIKNGPHGEKLKVDFDATKALSGGGPTGSSGSKNYSSREWQPESKYDPEKTARIGRAHAQGMALHYWTAFNEVLPEAALGPNATAEGVLEQSIRPLIDWFEADVNAAAQKAAQAGGGSTGNGSKATSSPDNTPGAQDKAEYLAKLLEDAGFDLAQAPVVQRYIETQLDNERRTKVEAALNDITLAPNAAAQLTKETEEWTGNKLPVHDPAGDEIPF